MQRFPFDYRGRAFALEIDGRDLVLYLNGVERKRRSRDGVECVYHALELAVWLCRRRLPPVCPILLHAATDFRFLSCRHLASSATRAGEDRRSVIGIAWADPSLQFRERFQNRRLLGV